MGNPVKNKQYVHWKKLNGYIESGKAFEGNKIYDIRKTVAKNKIYANLYIAAGQLIVGKFEQ